MENKKKTNKLLVNYIYSLTKDIYENKTSIQNHIIDATEDKPIRLEYIKILANNMKERSQAIIDICENISDTDRELFENIDNLKERNEIIESLKVFFN
jgi:hypothetical protein